MEPIAGRSSAWDVKRGINGIQVSLGDIADPRSNVVVQQVDVERDEGVVEEAVKFRRTLKGTRNKITTTKKGSTKSTDRPIRFGTKGNIHRRMKKNMTGSIDQ